MFEGATNMQRSEWGFETPEHSLLLVDWEGNLCIITCVDEKGVDIKNIETGEINPYTFFVLNLLFRRFNPDTDTKYLEDLKRAPWVQDRHTREVFSVVEEGPDNNSILLQSIVYVNKKIRVSVPEFLCNYNVCNDLNHLSIPQQDEVAEARNGVAVMVNKVGQEPKMVIKDLSALN